MGIVHIAPFFGEDDYRVGLENNIIVKDGDIVCPLDDSGNFLPDVVDFAGLYVKDANKPILKYLKEAGRLVSPVYMYPQLSLLLALRHSSNLSGDSLLVCPGRADKGFLDKEQPEGLLGSKGNSREEVPQLAGECP